MLKRIIIGMLLLLMAALVGCGTPTSALQPTAAPVPLPTATAYATSTPYPTHTPYPTYTPYPTPVVTTTYPATPRPTQTPTSVPTVTPIPCATATTGTWGGFSSLQEVMDEYLCRHPHIVPTPTPTSTPTPTPVAALTPTPASTSVITDDNDGQREDVLWVQDVLPVGAISSETWTWISNPTPFSGKLAHESVLSTGASQHVFTEATTTLAVNTGDTLFAYVYLDPDNPPTEIMLQWHNGSWEHRAYWGDNLIFWGEDGTERRLRIGDLPPLGQWVRLEVSASLMGLEGSTLTGMAFAQYGGRATWNNVGVETQTPSMSITVAPNPSVSVYTASPNRVYTASSYHSGHNLWGWFWFFFIGFFVLLLIWACCAAARDDQYVYVAPPTTTTSKSNWHNNSGNNYKAYKSQHVGSIHVEGNNNVITIVNGSEAEVYEKSAEPKTKEEVKTDTPEPDDEPYLLSDYERTVMAW